MCLNQNIRPCLIDPILKIWSLELCLALCLLFCNFEPKYAYKRYAYKKSVFRDSFSCPDNWLKITIFEKNTAANKRILTLWIES